MMAFRLEIVFALLSVVLLAWLLWRRHWGYVVDVGGTVAVALTSTSASPRLALACLPFALLTAKRVGDDERRHGRTVVVLTASPSPAPSPTPRAPGSSERRGCPTGALCLKRLAVDPVRVHRQVSRPLLVLAGCALATGAALLAYFLTAVSLGLALAFTLALALTAGVAAARRLDGGGRRRALVRLRAGTVAGLFATRLL